MAETKASDDPKKVDSALRSDNLMGAEGVAGTPDAPRAEPTQNTDTVIPQTQRPRGLGEIDPNTPAGVDRMLAWDMGADPIVEHLRRTRKDPADEDVSIEAHDLLRRSVGEHLQESLGGPPASRFARDTVSLFHGKKADPSIVKELNKRGSEAARGEAAQLNNRGTLTA